MKTISTLIAVIVLLYIFNACSATKLVVSSVSYQSIRNEHTDVNSVVPEDAVILVRHYISPRGSLEVEVRNLTDSTMIIDRRMSFFVNYNGVSQSFYDPTIQATTTTDVNLGTKGATVNLGTVAGAFGLNGVVGRTLNGVNVGSSSIRGQTVSNATYNIDQPSVAIGPRGMIGMGRAFDVSLVGGMALSGMSHLYDHDIHEVADNAGEATIKFSVIISFSIDGGKKYEKIVSDYYMDELMIYNVKDHGRTNESLRNILSHPNVLKKGWSIIQFDTNIPFSNSTYHINNYLFDYK